MQWEKEKLKEKLKALGNEFVNSRDVCENVISSLRP
jgi:hypothetical protein